MASKEYQIIVGTYTIKTQDVKWHPVKDFDTESEATKYFKKYVGDQFKYTDKDLKRVWGTGRLDIELMKGNRLLNWAGLYSRAASGDDDEDEESESSKKDKKEKKEK